MVATTQRTLLEYAADGLVWLDMDRQRFLIAGQPAGHDENDALFDLKENGLLEFSAPRRPGETVRRRMLPSGAGRQLLARAVQESQR